MPGADKIMNICAVLKVSPEELLSDEGQTIQKVEDFEIRYGDLHLLEDYHSFNENQQKRLYLLDMHQVEKSICMILWK